MRRVSADSRPQLMDPLLGLLIGLAIVAMAVSLWLYLALVLSLLLEQGPQGLESLPSPARGSGLLLEGLLRDPAQPWQSGLGLELSPYLFWPVALIVLAGMAGLGTYGYVHCRGLVGWLFVRTGSQSHGDSRWARAFDARLLGRRSSPQRLKPDGIVLGWWGRRVLQTPREDNAIVFGVQRSGKTSTVVVPTLLGWSGAAVATSTKEELVRLTGRHRVRLGPVWVFAPLDRELGWVSELGLRSAVWNPVAGASDAAAALELADLFTSDGKSGPSAHWYLSAASLIAGLILAARDEAGDLRSVITWLNTLGLNQYVGFANRQRDPVARELLTAFATTPSREAGSIASTARSSLSLWLDGRVARATAAKAPAGVDFDTENLLAEGATLYLVAPAEEAERCRPLFTALLQSLLAAATRRARRQGGVLQPRLLLALDEVANFARIPRLGGYASSGPGQGLQLLLCFHDLAQLESGYGTEQARTVWNNCRARLLLPGQGDLRTLEHFSRAIGDETRDYELASRTSEGRWSQAGQRVGKPLASADALRRMREPILLFGSAPPAKLRARRWDQVPAWRALVSDDSTEPEVSTCWVDGLFRWVARLFPGAAERSGKPAADRVFRSATSFRPSSPEDQPRLRVLNGGKTGPHEPKPDHPGGSAA
ncbi:MAG: hypothetical protein DLM66_03775 [Candidatus Dormiibacter spiritus]|nr:MAG: hypothetical protein DLM66_03775 [Candidatus Dormibacteraeota bacterium]